MKKIDSLSNARRAAALIERIGRLLRSGDHASGLNPAQSEALRYLARANRFSSTPAALADYLGSTRGTVSQTLIALESKGLVEKQKSASDGRSVRLGLTPAGHEALEDDAISRFASDIAGQVDAGALADLLEQALRAALSRRGGRSFGACQTCMHFRRGTGGLHHCSLLDEPLTASDASAICAEHTA